MEQRRFLTHAALVNQGNYAAALMYLTHYQQRDLPLARRLEPSPYEYRVWRDLPPTISLLRSNTPPWIRHVYLSHLTATLSHHFAGYDSLTNVAPMIAAIEQLPEGCQWLLTNQVALARQWLKDYSTRTEPGAKVELNARTNIVSTLRRMGMAETNLAADGKWNR